MKKISKLLVILLPLALVGLYSCDGFGDDFLDEETTCQEYCDMTELSSFFQNHGDCMSLCQTCNNPSDSPATSAVCVCNWLEGYLTAIGIDWKDVADATNNDGSVIPLAFKNKGQCIKFYTQAFKGGQN